MNSPTPASAEIIIGIDPGSRITGYGVVQVIGGTTQYVASGHLKVDVGTLPERLQAVFEGVSEVVRLHRPTQMAVEQVFMAKNADSALKLGQARGAAICAGTNQGLTVAEYTARQVKQAIVGTGGADKVQVQHMVKALLGLRGLPQADEADALAVALCHASASQTLTRFAQAQAFGRGRFR